MKRYYLEFKSISFRQVPSRTMPVGVGNQLSANMDDGELHRRHLLEETAGQDCQRREEFSLSVG
eukprot:6468325-Amphidinium_carterae.1